MNRFETVVPSTGEPGRTHPHHTAREVTARLDRSSAAFQDWRRSTFDERATYLAEVGEQLRARSEELAWVMAEEMGKPVTAGRSEVEKCAWLCDWMATDGLTFLADRPAPIPDAEVSVVYRPVGGVLGVMPWNYPLWQVVRYATAALAAGNTVVLKHAPNVLRCAAALESVFDPGDGRFTQLIVPVDRLPEVVSHSHVRAACLTGSERAGRAYGQLTAKHLIPTVLELGGNDASVVLRDADVEAAAEAIATSRLLNGGQSCIASKRMIVVDEVYEAFLEAFVAAMGSRTMGDPLNDATDLGPMARQDLRDTLHAQVQGSLRAGARCVLGGELPSGPGFYYPPTVVTGVPPTSALGADEVFGPVAAVFRVANEAEAVELANASSLGLGASVYTADLERGRRIAADELEAGSCFVNSFVKSDPRVPFGGIGHSGYGRELGPEGVRSFTNVKTVWVSST